MHDFEIRELTQLFYSDYPSSKFSEIVHKNSRPYDVVVFEMTPDYFVCIPFRTNINHNNCFHFKNSHRSLMNKSGLDYSKILIIRNPKYIGGYAIIDSDEASEFRKNLHNIHKDAFSYIETYKNHINGFKQLHPEMFKRKYGYTTLKYFHSELGID